MSQRKLSTLVDSKNYNNKDMGGSQHDKDFQKEYIFQIWAPLRNVRYSGLLYHRSFLDNL